MSGRKDDQGKIQLTRIMELPDDVLDALVAVSAVFSYGARKYGPENWKKLDMLEERYIAAALRHARERLVGSHGETDIESGLPSLAHAVCSLIFVMVNDEAVLRSVTEDVESVDGTNE